jgi:hypothetical protein
MSSIVTSDIFFFITSLAVICLTVILSIAGIYLVRILKDFKEVSSKFKHMVTMTEGEFENIYTRLTESWIFKFLFSSKKPVRKRDTKES